MDELSLCLVTDRRQTRDRDLVEVVAACVQAGLPALQVREKDLGALEQAALCRRLRARFAGRRPLLVVNDRADVALAVGADGVQRTHTSLSVRDLRAVLGPDRRIGASVHALDQARRAADAGADWLTFGPVYDTPSKRAYGAPLGVAALEEVSRAVAVPVVAVGGITPARVAEVVRAGARGVSVISAILAAPSPAEAVARFLEALAAAGR